VAEVEALGTKEVDLAVMVLLMGMALQVLRAPVLPVALAVLPNKDTDHLSDLVEVDIVGTSNVKDLVGTMTGTPNDRDTSCGRVRYVQLSHFLLSSPCFKCYDSALGGVRKYRTPLLSHCSAAFA